MGHNIREVRHKGQLYFNKPIYYYLALINREGGLYGRILTEVVSTDRGQDSAIQTDLARLIRCLFDENKNN